MARIEIDKISKIDKTIREHEVVRATYSVANTNENDCVFQIDTYSGSEQGDIIQTLQFNEDNLGKLMKLISLEFKSFSIPLLDDKGEVKYGINWGNRANRNVNQAYLDLPVNIYNSDFFPTNGNRFIIRTDDNQNLTFTRAQKDNVNGHALQTPEDNSIIGLYLRQRLSIPPGEVISKESIEAYGRNYITISKIGQFYYLDFASSKTKLLVPGKKPYHPLQQIFYGAPGTGKSHTIDEDTNESNRIRTTFHPDYDYATFVGAYKPTVKKVDRYGLFGKDTVTLKHEDNTPIKEDVIVYKFIPQAFIKAYVEAWRRYADAECTDKDFYLVIEEINRGNCAQIFGDLFQLLDRTNAGFSSYAVETESDLQSFLTTDEEYKLDIVLTEDIKNDNGKVIATAENVMNGKVLVLPPNLHIWATMNTSDQSLFPIDSAFKRRWDWKYVPIKYDNSDWKVMLGDKEVCKWTELQQTLNDLIYDATESEDKMLGDWFVKADDKNEINEEQLVGKIIFYLWNDVAKVDAGKLFDLEIEKNGRKRKVIFSDFYKIDGNVNSETAREWLKNIKVLRDETAEDETPNEPEQ